MPRVVWVSPPAVYDKSPYLPATDFIALGLAHAALHGTSVHRLVQHTNAAPDTPISRSELHAPCGATLRKIVPIWLDILQHEITQQTFAFEVEPPQDAWKHRQPRVRQFRARRQGARHAAADHREIPVPCARCAAWQRPGGGRELSSNMQSITPACWRRRSASRPPSRKPAASSRKSSARATTIGDRQNNGQNTWPAAPQNNGQTGMARERSE